LLDSRSRALDPNDLEWARKLPCELRPRWGIIMAFVAECTFCHLMLQAVPDNRRGSSVECPRCHNSFTLAPMVRPLAAATRGPRIIPKKAPPATPPAAVEAPVSPPPSFEGRKPPQPAHASERIEKAGPVTARPPMEEVPQTPTPKIVQYPVSPRRISDYPGLASFALGSFAFLAAAIFHVGLLTFALGLAGLLFGVFGLLVRSGKQGRPVLTAVGLAVSLPAVLLAALWPGWLGLNPLWDPPAPPEHKGPVVLSLSGRGDFRDAEEGEALWVDASKDALHQGDVRLRVVSALVGAAQFEPIQGKEPPAVRCLMIHLRITNAGIARKLPYTGWGSEARPVLHDDRGKSYGVKTFAAGWVVKGRAMSSSIPPGKSLNDVIVFEAPPATISYLRLELPASAVGAEGQLQMEIPKRAIVFR
jgi:hypothetical protein